MGSEAETFTTDWDAKSNGEKLSASERKKRTKMIKEIRKWKGLEAETRRQARAHAGVGGGFECAAGGALMGMCLGSVLICVSDSGKRRSGWWASCLPCWCDVARRAVERVCWCLRFFSKPIFFHNTLDRGGDGPTVGRGGGPRKRRSQEATS